MVCSPDCSKTGAETEAGGQQEGAAGLCAKVLLFQLVLQEQGHDP